MSCRSELQSIRLSQGGDRRICAELLLPDVRIRTGTETFMRLAEPAHLIAILFRQYGARHIDNPAARFDHPGCRFEDMSLICAASFKVLPG